MWLLPLVPALATAPLRGTQSVPARETPWLDEFLNDDIINAARWEQARVGRETLEEAGNGSLMLTYGEFDVDCFRMLVQRAIALTSNDVESLSFCDIGSGAGRLVLAAAAGWPFRCCIGVEMMDSLHTMAIDLHAAACDLADSLDVPLAPCKFAQVDLTDSDAAEHTATVDIAFAFSTCFDDMTFATALRGILPAGAILITIDALMPNCEKACSAKSTQLPYYHLVDTAIVPSSISDDATEQDGIDAPTWQTAYFWRLCEDRPRASIDFAILENAANN